jgi:hypothetical protein
MSGKEDRRATFNDLDEKFQIHPGDDPEKIFPEELEMIETLRKEIPECKEMSDKYLVFFLCSRRHAMEEVKLKLKNFVEVRKKTGMELFNISLMVGSAIPLIDSENFKDIEWLFQMNAHYFGGVYDIHQRIIMYLNIGRTQSHQMEEENFQKFILYTCDYNVTHVPLAMLRNGSLVVVDFKDFHLGSLDIFKEKRLQAFMEGEFF